MLCCVCIKLIDVYIPSFDNPNKKFYKKPLCIAKGIKFCTKVINEENLLKSAYDEATKK